MEILAGVFGAAIIFIVLWDAFETIVLPRRVPRRVRLTRLFYRSTWRPWSALARLLSPGKRRETYLSFYGPLSLLLLLSVWAAGLIVGFAIMHWALGSAIIVVDKSVPKLADLSTTLMAEPNAQCIIAKPTISPAAHTLNRRSSESGPKKLR